MYSAWLKSGSVEMLYHEWNMTYDQTFLLEAINMGLTDTHVNLTHKIYHEGGKHNSPAPATISWGW